MAKAVVQVVEAICDRCGAVGDTGYSDRTQQWGELYIDYKGGRGYPFDGNLGGAEHQTIRVAVPELHRCVP